MLKLMYPFIAVLVLIVLPLALIYRRAKHGKSVKKPLYANLAGFFTVFAACAVVFLAPDNTSRTLSLHQMFLI